MDLRSARKRAGLSQTKLAEIAKTDQGSISGIESGDRPLGERLAERLARHVPAYAPELVVENQFKVLNKALDTSDKLAALESCLAILKTVQPFEDKLDPDARRNLNRIADQVSMFAASDYDGILDFEDEDYFEDDRDFYGRRISGLKDLDDDLGGIDGDGRDIYGRRIRS